MFFNDVTNVNSFFRIPNVQFEDSMVFKNYVFFKKNSGFNTKFHVFSKLPCFQKFPVRETEFLHKIPCFLKTSAHSKNSPFERRSFNTKFHVFSKIPHVQKIPRSKKHILFKKSLFSIKYAS